MPRRFRRWLKRLDAYVLPDAFQLDWRLRCCHCSARSRRVRQPQTRRLRRCRGSLSKTRSIIRSVLALTRTCSGPRGRFRSALASDDRPTGRRDPTRSIVLSTPHAAANMPLWIAVDAPPTRRCDDTVARHVERCFRAARAAPSPFSKWCFDSTPADLQRFAIEVAATEARARGSGVLVARQWRGCCRDAVRMAQQLTADQAPYLDLLVLDDAMSGAGVASLAAARRAIPGLKILRRARQGDTGAHRARHLVERRDRHARHRRGNATSPISPRRFARLRRPRNLLSHPTQEIDPDAGRSHPRHRWRRCSRTRSRIGCCSMSKRSPPISGTTAASPGTRVDVALRLAFAGRAGGLTI